MSFVVCSALRHYLRCCVSTRRKRRQQKNVKKKRSKAETNNFNTHTVRICKHKIVHMRMRASRLTTINAMLATRRVCVRVYVCWNVAADSHSFVVRCSLFYFILTEFSSQSVGDDCGILKFTIHRWCAYTKRIAHFGHRIESTHEGFVRVVKLCNFVCRYFITATIAAEPFHKHLIRKRNNLSGIEWKLMQQNSKNFNIILKIN